jgi:hypothetical protein
MALKIFYSLAYLSRLPVFSEHCSDLRVKERSFSRSLRLEVGVFLCEISLYSQFLD